MIVGVIADPHEPYADRRYLPFVEGVFEKACIEHVLCIGDFADLYSFSNFPKNPDFHVTPAREIGNLRRKVDKWASIWPEMDICEGNHERRIKRAARDAGLLNEMVKGYNEVFGAPEGWVWKTEFCIDGVDYIHTCGLSGITAARRGALERGRSMVMGHLHTYASIEYIQQIGRRKPIFGMMVGCGCDKKAPVFKYDRDPRRWINACAVVYDGEPVIYRM